MQPSRSLALLAATLLVLGLSAATALADYGSMSPRALIERSIVTPSAAERAQIRGHLARHHPESGEGLAARAWLAKQSGAHEEGMRLYRQATERAPDLWLAWFNLAVDVRDFTGDGQEALRLLERALAAEPSEGYIVRALYFHYLEELEDRAAADRFLAEQRSRLGSDFWAFPMIEALLAEFTDRDLPRAADLYLRAALAGGDEETIQLYLEISLDRLRADPATVLRNAVAYAERFDDATAYRMIADRLADFGNRAASLDFYRRAMAADPHAEVLRQAVDKLLNEMPAEVLGFVDDWAPRLDQVWLAAHVHAETFDGYRFDPERARSLRERAIALAPHDNARATAVAGAVIQMHDRYDLDAAHRLLTEEIARMPEGANRNHLTSFLLENRLRAGDHAAATRVSAELPDDEVPGVNDSWLQAERQTLTRAILLEAERQAFYRRNPFLQNWDERFGESLTLAVEFEINAATLRPGSFPLLDEAARALQAPGGEDYVFLIEGHTDITGTDAINLPLSERRAAAVADYLSQTHGIPRERLQTVGYGPYHPVATNETDAGRQRNRRVEIRPYGRVGEPEVAVSGALDASAMAVSDDGRLLATGLGPIQLWDTRRQVRVRELYRGGRERVFSPNSRYLAVSSSYTEVGGATTNTLYVYDTKTGHAVAALPDTSLIRSIAWSPFSDEVAFANDAGYLRIYSLGERRIRAVERVGPVRNIARVEWLADGRLVTDQVRGGGLTVWDAEDLTPLQRLPGGPWPHAMRASRDGRWLVQVDNDRTISIYDTETWEVRSLASPHLIPDRMVPHPSRPWMLLNDFTGSSAGVAVLDLENARLIAAAPAAGRAGIGFSPDGGRALVAEGDVVRWLDSETLAEVDRLEGLAVEASGLLVDEDNLNLVAEDAEGSYVFSLSSGRRVHRMVTGTEHGWAALGGGRFAAVDREGYLVVFDGNDFSEQRQQPLGFLPTRRPVAAGPYLLAAGLPHGQPESEDAVGVLAVFDSETLQERYRLEIPLVTAPLRFDRVLDLEIGYLAASAEQGLFALITQWRDGWGQPTSYSDRVRLFRLDDGSPASEIRYGGRPFYLAFRDDEDSLALTLAGEGAYLYSVEGAFLRRETVEAGFGIDLADGRTLRWARDFIQLGDRRVFRPDSLREVAVVEAANMVIAQTQANELLFFGLEDLELQLTIVVKRDDQWIAYTPEGYYSASQQGTEGVYWSLGDHYLPFAALRGSLERAHIVQQRLEALMAGRARPEPRTEPGPTLDPSLFETPYRVTLASESGFETDEAVYRLRLAIAKASAELPDPEIRYSLNGRPVPLGRGFEEEAFWDQGESEEELLGIERAFALQEGYNRIEAALLFRGAEIERQVAEVTRRPPPSSGPVSPTAQLWFFGVGISDYEIATQNLEYAHRDAEELARALAAQEGVLFSRVNTRVLTNAEATERNVRIEMNDFLRQASEEDLIVVFLAGHGVQDNEQNLYLMTHDADMQRPFTGMSLDLFRDFLRSRPINQKAMLLLDICHAGSVGPRRRGRVVAEDAIQQLSDGTGTVVFASSTGAQSSLEGPEFGGGHGAFTAALLEAVTGAADREAGNGDGLNSLHEIISYTSRRVPQLTGGAQHPTVPMLENVRDFPISVAGQ